MKQVNTLLEKRLGKSKSVAKIEQMAKQSQEGHLTSFSGVFALTEISHLEKDNLHNLLNKFKTDHISIDEDFNELCSLTSEIKAITNQAVLLHGERIKKAQDILIRYKDGAFTSWLISTYGNRQTPYNFLLYYEFYSKIPTSLKKQLEDMPRQAVYTLASRNGSFEKKKHIIETFKGETKTELLYRIRKTFPLPEKDLRNSNPIDQIIKQLKMMIKQFSEATMSPTLIEKKNLLQQVHELKNIISRM